MKSLCQKNATVTVHCVIQNGKQVPINYRIYDKSEEKTKNQYFIEMLAEVISWGVKPAWITGDSWYSALHNLNNLKNEGLSFMFAIQNNRLVSLSEGSEFCQVCSLDIPKTGLNAYLKDFGAVVIFRTTFKDEYRYYVMHQSESKAVNRKLFKEVHDTHWNIEQYHRALKQVCNIETFQVRTEIAIRNHIFSALAAFIQLEFLTKMDVLENWYQLQRTLFNDVIAKFILSREIPEGLPFAS